MQSAQRDEEEPDNQAYVRRRRSARSARRMSRTIRLTE
jgi:hypothetical protein